MRRTSSCIWRYGSKCWGEFCSIEDTEGKEGGCAVGLKDAVGTLGCLFECKLLFLLGAGGVCPIDFPA